MVFNTLFAVFSIIIVFFSKKFNLFIHLHVSDHKRFVSTSKVSLLGGLIFLIFLSLKLNINNYFFFIPFFFLGLLSDINFLSDPKKRLLIQIILIFVLIIFLKIKISKTNLFILDYLLKNNYFNIFFTLFCLIVLINGSNFIDGLNGLLIGYILIIFTIIYFVLPSLNYDKNLIKNFLFILSLIYLLNLCNILYLGDSGAYLLSIFSGYLLINLANQNLFVSPFFIVLLLWYPCFENLFSIIRRKKSLYSSFKPDNKHLHHLIYLYFLKKCKIKKLAANIFTSILINFYNLFFFYFSAQFIIKTKIVIMLILLNIIIYLLIYYYLHRIFYRRSDPNLF